METKAYIKLMSRIAAIYLILLPISCIGIKVPSKGSIVAGVAALSYLIVCYVADREDTSD